MSTRQHSAAVALEAARASLLDIAGSGSPGPTAFAVAIVARWEDGRPEYATRAYVCATGTDSTELLGGVAELARSTLVERQRLRDDRGKLALALVYDAGRRLVRGLLRRPRLDPSPAS